MFVGYTDRLEVDFGHTVPAVDQRMVVVVHNVVEDMAVVVVVHIAGEDRIGADMAGSIELVGRTVVAVDSLVV